MVFKLIRTVLGLESSDSSGGTDVTVERESDTAAADTDAAASTGSMTDESEEGAAEPAEAAGSASTSIESDTEPEPSDESQEDAAVAGTDAAASTGSMTEEPPEPDAAAEPAEAAGPTSGADSLDPGDDSESVEDVSGIGPAYADRLSAAGIETVDQLLDADPENLSADTDLSDKRISRWQERAEEL
jgi:predicted flap endonuclease-1-like 5' DNA nuclease